jgi:hypothetical protein
VRKIIAAGVLILSLAGVLLLIHAKVGGTQQAGQVGVSYAPVAAEITLHEPVIVNFTVYNGLSRLTRIDLGADFKENFAIAVKLPDGKIIKARQLAIFGPGGGSSLIGILSLTPGETYKQGLLLNEWFDFNMPGKYEVEVTLVNPRQENKLMSVTGNKMTFEIRPRDANKLVQVCASLAESVVGATSYQGAADATRALSYVQDPVAVPYLERALRSGHLVEQIAIEGLERIGSGEAVQTLISALRIHRGDTDILARSALLRIERKTQDPRLKQMIKRALIG